METYAAVCAGMKGERVGMEPAEREKKIRSVQAHRHSFVVTPPNGKYKFVKRLNEAAASALTAVNETLNALQAQVDALQRQTSRSIIDFTREQRQTLARAQTEQQDAIEAMRSAQADSLAQSERSQQRALHLLSEDMNRAMLSAAPESRTRAGIAPLTALELHGSDALHTGLRAVQQAVDDDSRQTALDALEQQYTSYLKDALHAQASGKCSRPMALVCRSFASGGGMEAIRNEVWDLYRLLKKASRYPVCILSIEPGDAAESKQGDVYFVPENALAAWLRAQDPSLLIFCESTTAILNAGQQCMLLRNSLVRLSAQNPAQKLGGSNMQEMLHLCDYGIQHYCTASQAAADTMESLGFRRPAVFYPYIDTDKPLFCRRPRVYDAEKFTVGFASSPMQPEQADSRGIPALCELVQQNPDMKFCILWRDSEAVPVPEENAIWRHFTVRLTAC